MQPILSTAYDGKPRWLYPKTCEACLGTFYVPKNQIHKRRACSVVCRGKLRRRREQVVCGTCRKPFERVVNKLGNSKSGVYFCCRKCKDEGQRIEGVRAAQPGAYKDGASNYRDRALRDLGERCCRCGYDTDKRMLDVHHKDGNRKNAALSNLDVVCVWCHALDTRRVVPHPWEGLTTGG
jgi:hypothetical protein